MNQNLNDPRHPWTRLTKAAREVRHENDASAPYGFATRVAALAFAQEQRMASLFERFALRALGVSCLLALGSVALNYDALTSGTPVAEPGAIASVGDVLMPTPDAAAIILDIAD